MKLIITVIILSLLTFWALRPQQKSELLILKDISRNSENSYLIKTQAWNYALEEITISSKSTEIIKDIENYDTVVYSYYHPALFPEIKFLRSAIIYRK